MIFLLIKSVMKECGLNQQAMADVLGVPLHRVKSITSGKVQKLTREESEALVRKLNVRPGYLVTGQLPLFQTSGEQAFQTSLDTVARATQQAVAAELTPGQADVYQRVMLASKMGDFATLKQLVISLSGDENEMLENYRRCSSTGQRALLTTSAEMAVAEVVPQAPGILRPAMPKGLTMQSDSATEAVHPEMRDSESVVVKQDVKKKKDTDTK